MPQITDEQVLQNARVFNASRPWNRPGMLKADHPALINSTLVQETLAGMMAETGCSREVAEDALMRAHNLGEILTPEELAERLKVPVGWVYEKQRARCKNPLPSIPMGRYIRFDWEQVITWLEAQANPRPMLVTSAPRRKKAV